MQPGGAGGDQRGGQGAPQVQHGDLLPRRDVAEFEPAAVQRRHGDAAQLGLGDLQAQVSADLDQPPGT